VPFFDAPDGTFVLNVEVNGVPAQMALDTELKRQCSMSVRQVGKHKRLEPPKRVSSRCRWRFKSGRFRGNKTFRIGGLIRTPTVFLARFAGYDLTAVSWSAFWAGRYRPQLGIIDVARQVLLRESELAGSGQLGPACPDFSGLRSSTLALAHRELI
jgi:hypothetical protein